MTSDEYKYRQDITFGRTLTIARAVRGMKQAELARRAGFAPSYVCHLEAGKRQGTLHCLDRLAAALDMSPSQLLAAAEVADKMFPKKGAKAK